MNEGRYTENADGTLTLVRWPRTKEAAVIPAQVEGRAVTRIAPMAFAPFHMEEKDFVSGFRPPYSFNMFILMSGGKVTHEKTDEGGPEEVVLPDTVREIGAYAFWHCHSLKKVNVPAGVKLIRAGTFGECVNLKKVSLPDSLIAVGLCDEGALQDRVQNCISGEMLRGMPDVGAFYACHSLKELVLPESLRVLGAHTFNSSGLVKLRIATKEAFPGKEKARAADADYAIADNAFDHAASLQWMDKLDRSGRTAYRIGLPAARDKILIADRTFGRLSHIPKDFFTEKAVYFDQLAQEVFRLDFSARLALGRLRYDGALLPEYRAWYIRLLIDHFAQAPQFMPEDPKQPDPFAALFSALMETGDLTAGDVSSLIRTAGEEHLSSALLNEMMRVRTESFSMATGFEDLEI